MMAGETQRYSVLFVCMGNICRSPTAEAVFRRQAELSGLARHLHIDSAGTHDFHTGKPPDARAQSAAGSRGYQMAGLRARSVSAQDFARYDYILCMDQENLAQLRAMQPPDFGGYLGLFLDFAPWAGTREVPDPYYGGPGGFQHVLDLVEEGAKGLLAEIEARRRP